MKTYNIPILWQSYMRVEVEADNLQEATEQALKKFLAIPDDNYLDDSFEVDEIIFEEHPDETVSLHQAYESI